MTTEMKQAFNEEALLTSGTATSEAYQTRGATAFRFQYTITGTGTVEIEIMESLDGVTYATNATAIGSTLAAGTALLDLTAKPSVYVKFKVTEDGGAAAAGISLYVLW